jgi:hypothetical protein
MTFLAREHCGCGGYPRFDFVREVDGYLNGLGLAVRRELEGGRDA